MTVRTTSKTVTFVHPFSLSGAIEAHPAGTYTVETDEELLQPSSLPAYRRIATLLRLERNTGAVLTQIVETNPADLAGALARDAQPVETVAQRAHSEAVVSPKRARGRMKSFSEGWKDWVTFMHPFSLTGTDEVQPAGTYTVELLQPSSLPAYRRIATLLRLERNMGTVLTQIVETNPVDSRRL